MAPRYREFVESVAQALAEQPERVQVEELPNGAAGDGPASDLVRLRLVVSPADVGNIVGRRGRTAKAIRTLLTAAGNCELEIEGSGEEEGEDEDSELPN